MFWLKRKMSWGHGPAARGAVRTDMCPQDTARQAIAGDVSIRFCMAPVLP